MRYSSRSSTEPDRYEQTIEADPGLSGSEGYDCECDHEGEGDDE
jgi:hypothetical protein